jgi:hypothetical protein
VPSRAHAAVAFGAALVVASFAALAYSVIETSRATVAATTENRSSVFGSASIDLQVGRDDPDGASEQLLFDAEGLYPGAEVEACVTIESTSDIPLSVRLHGAREGGSGLDEYLDVRFETGLAGSTGDCTGFIPGDVIFDDRLVEMWRRHGDFDRGIELATATTSYATTLRATATVVDDNAAQGLTTNFWVTVEARP